MYTVTLTFKNGNTINYESLDNEVAQWWFESTLLEAYSDSNTQISNIDLTNTQINFSEFTNIEEAVKKLTENIEVLKKAGYNIPYTVDTGIDQHALNRLHEFFHTSIENSIPAGRKVIPIDVEQNIVQLNYNIHRLEAYLRNSKVKSYAVVSPRGYPNFIKPLTEEIRNKFTENYYQKQMQNTRSGYLGFVNYSTIGKNLHHTYWDNDIDIVTKKLLRNKRDTDPQIMLGFPANTVPIQKEIVTWLERNSVDIQKTLTEEYFNQYYPPIMQMSLKDLKRLTNYDIYDLFANIKLQHIYIKKED